MTFTLWDILRAFLATRWQALRRKLTKDNFWAYMALVWILIGLATCILGALSVATLGWPGVF